MQTKTVDKIKKIVFLTIISMALLGAAAAGKGAKDMVLDGGTYGEVPFPHHLHQERLEQNCGACHDLFPQESGVIVKMKKDGELKGKKVMNKLCVKCHRTFKKENKKTGPTACAKCHKRG